MGGYGAQYGSSGYGFETLGVPPILQNQDPAPGEIDVLRQSNVILELFDDISGVNFDSVIISIDGVKCWENNAAATGFSGTRTSITDGYRYEINPNDLMRNFTFITVGVYVESENGGVLDEEYQFKTAYQVGPELKNRDPVSQERYVERNRPIIFDLTDDQGVNESSIKIYVNDVIAWENSSQQSDFVVTETVIVDGYNFYIDPPSDFDYDETVSVRVVSLDLAPEQFDSDEIYSFKTVTTPPIIVVQTPVPNGEASSATNIVIGLEHKFGIRLNSIKVFIIPGENEPIEVAFDGSKSPQFTVEYNGSTSEIIPIAKGYQIVMDRVDNFEIGNQITAYVRAAVSD